MSSPICPELEEMGERVKQRIKEENTRAEDLTVNIAGIEISALDLGHGGADRIGLLGIFFYNTDIHCSGARCDLKLSSPREECRFSQEELALVKNLEKLNPVPPPCRND